VVIQTYIGLIHSSGRYDYEYSTIEYYVQVFENDVLNSAVEQQFVYLSKSIFENKETAHLKS